MSIQIPKLKSRERRNRLRGPGGIEDNIQELRDNYKRCITRRASLAAQLGKNPPAMRET